MPSPPIITAAEARRWIPGLTGTTEDAELEILISAADGALANYCNYPEPEGEDTPNSRGKTLTRSDYSLYLSGSSLEPQVLRIGVFPLSPAGTAPTVSIDPDRIYPVSSQISAITDFEYLPVDLRAEGKFILRVGGKYGAWPTAWRSIKVVVNAGYDSGDAGFDDVPRDVEVACGLLVAHWWQLRHTSGLTNVSQAGGSAGLVSGAIPDNVKQLMEPYRLSGNWLG